MDEDKFGDAIDAATVADCTKVLGKIRAAIAPRRYMAFQGAPNVNDRLVTVINNVGDQLRHSQRIHNANYSRDQTTTGTFWSEWVRDMTHFLFGGGKTWAEGCDN